VALELDFPDLDRSEKSDQPDAVVLMSTARAVRLAHAIVRATTKARQATTRTDDTR